MSKPLHVVIGFLAIVSLNRIECVKLSRKNVISLGGVRNDLSNKKISEIEPLALDVIKSTILYLSGNELTYLQENLFQFNTKFEELRFHTNNISEIHPLVFQGLQNLSRIDLYENELTEIPENLFERNSELETIYLNKNRITFFHPNTFKNLKNLVYLYVNSNQLTSFDFNILSSSKELQLFELYENDLTEIHYQDLKLHFPKLEWVAFTENNFNCSFANQVEDYLDKEHIVEHASSISCISDEAYAAIVRDRQFNTPVRSQGSSIQLNLEEQCSNITLELRNIIEGLKLQLLEKQSVIERLQIDNDHPQSVTVKGKDDSEKKKADNEDIYNEIKGLKVQLQFITEKMKIDIEDVNNVIKGLKSQLLEQHAATDELKFCCRMSITA